MAEFVNGLPADQFWIMVGVGSVLGVAGFFGAFVLLRRARIIEDTPTSRVRSCAQGYAELEGRARVLPGPDIVAPLTGTRCCWWRYKIERRERDSKGNTHWDTIAHGRSDDLFLLADATGECVIDPHGAHVIPAATDVWYGAGARPAMGPRLRGGWLSRVISGDYRYTEERLERDGSLYAIGGFRTKNGGETLADSREADLRELLAKWKTDPQMKQLLDVNKDGVIDQQEWEAARRMAARRVTEASTSAPVPDDVNVLGEPGGGRPFVLSGIPQAKVVRDYKAKGAVFLFGSIVLGAWCLYAVQVRDDAGTTPTPDGASMFESIEQSISS